MRTGKKAVVFTLMSVLIAASMFSLLTNYRLFVTELERETVTDVGISQTFLYAGSHIQEIADMETRTTFNETHTFVNFTDRGFRDSRYNNSLRAYRDFMENKMNLSYSLDFNDTIPTRDPAFNIRNMNAEYNYSNFTKHNISLLQKEGNATFIKRYELEIDAASSAVSVSDLVTVSETSGELNVFIDAAGQTVSSSVSRTDPSRYRVEFDSDGTVNITVGQVYGVHNSSFRAEMHEKAWVNSSVTAKTSRLP